MLLSTLLSRIIISLRVILYISQMSLLSIISSNSTRSFMSLLLPSKLAIQYSSASDIVPYIMQVNSSDLWYNYLYLIGWKRQTIEFNVTNHAKQ